QFVAWVNAKSDNATRRMLLLSAVFLPLPFLISIFLQNVGAPISTLTVVVATGLLGAIFLLPTVAGWGERVSYATWNRAGFSIASAYILAAVYAHHAAFQRVQKFAEFEHLQVDVLGALPFPPSLWHWDGLVRTSHGVYEFRTDLASRPGFLSEQKSDAADPIEY